MKKRKFIDLDTSSTAKSGGELGVNGFIIAVGIGIFLGLMIVILFIK